MQPKDPRSSQQWLTDEHPRNIHFTELPAETRRGRSAVTVTEVVLGAAAAEETMPDGARVTIGVPLRSLVEELGGYEGTLEHPATGQRLPVSLRQWQGRDLDATLIRVGFTFKPIR
ncbi:hypothetical protein [Actinoplanes sp. N902-109]|uniref:hypothetical protein n=1 Tax=Actinoplanes sp. (strain N902-109) TaxID=649831 RepID=UPI0003294E3D|nr:hypothetical protein [Actinoplanes sp. N902-109]AGL17626.1 hypothetical protein L083_4116 [Actinoplanes sp. N902-109]